MTSIAEDCRQKEARVDREPAPSGWIGHSRRRARRGTESVTLPSPTAGLVAPVSVAEIELADPVQRDPHLCR